MSADFQHDIFLSHISKDKAVERDVAVRFKKLVCACGWMRSKSSPAKIEESLKISRMLVLCMSIIAYGSAWAQMEAGMCSKGNLPFRDLLNKNCRFFPLWFDSTPIKGCLVQFFSSSGAQTKSPA